MYIIKFTYVRNPGLNSLVSSVYPVRREKLQMVMVGRRHVRDYKWADKVVPKSMRGS